MSKRPAVFGIVIFRLLILTIGLVSLFSLRSDVFYYLKSNTPVALDKAKSQSNQYVSVSDLPDLTTTSSFGSTNKQMVYYLYPLSSYPNVIVLTSAQLPLANLTYEGRLLPIQKTPYAPYAPKTIIESSARLASTHVLIVGDTPKQHRSQFFLAILCAVFCLFQVWRIGYALFQKPQNDDSIDPVSQNIDPAIEE